MTERTRWIGLVVFLVVCLGAGGLGAVATTPEIEGWYPIAKKWQEQRLVRNEFGIDAGPSWSNEDHAFAEIVLNRLTSEVDALRQPRK